MSLYLAILVIFAPRDVREPSRAEEEQIKRNVIYSRGLGLFDLLQKER